MVLIKITAQKAVNQTRSQNRRMDISVPCVGILLLDIMLIGCCGSKTCYYAVAQLYVEVQAFILVPLSRVFSLRAEKTVRDDKGCLFSSKPYIQCGNIQTLPKFRSSCKI